MRAASLVLVAAGLWAAGASLAAQAEGRMPSYEPPQRLRSPLDTCLRDEVLREAYCVKKCAQGFRMDPRAKTPRCEGLSPDAKYTPPVPNFKPLARDPKAQPVPGA